MAEKTRWSIETEYIQSCNCDYGCPCNFNALPTHGNCEALVAYRVRQGDYAGTKLDGVKFALAVWWPRAIHQGGGTGQYYVDPTATAAQRKGIEAITSGQQGGGVFEIFPKTFSTFHPLKNAKIDFHYEGYNSWFTVDGVGEVHSEHIKNPVTGEKFEGEVTLPGGIAWKKAIVTNIKNWFMHDGDLIARHANRSGFATVAKFTQAGCVG